MHRIVVILFIAAFSFEKGFTKIPDFIHPCNLNNSTCLLQSVKDAIPGFAKGIPELGVPPMDPMYIEKLPLPISGLKVTFYNTKVTGLRKSIVEDAHIENDKLTLVLRGNMTLKGQYEMDGTTVALPVNGKGDAKVKMINLKLTFIINTAPVTDEKGVQHLTTMGYKHMYDYGDKVTYNFTNLFVGNPEISNIILTILNDNWRLIAEEFGKPFLDYGIDLAVSAIEKFFMAVPYVDLIDGS